MFKSRLSGPKQNKFRAISAPFGGLDYENALFSMPENNATALSNFFPVPDGLVTRPGRMSHVTGFSATVDSLHTYSAVTGAQSLWACCSNGVFNATTPGIVGSSVIAITNGNCISTQISTGAGAYLFLVNGTDTCKRYDGTTWTSIAAFGTASNLYNYIALYRQRLFFVKKDSLEIEYLAPNSIAGTATNYPLGAIFSMGGKIVALCPWTIDSGTGPEDNLAIITDQGQVAIYNGNDPAVWVLRGVYYVGRPLGNRPMTPYGGDVLLLTESGVIPLSALVQSTSIDRVQTLTQQIRQYIINNAKLYSANYGWQLMIDPNAPYVMVNIPVLFAPTQAVMNSRTGAWTTWQGLNARALGRMGSNVYISAPGSGTASVYRLDPTSGLDNSTPIVASFSQAYSRWGRQGNKLCQSIKPYFASDSAFTYKLGFAYDFQAPPETTTISVSGSGIVQVEDEWQVGPDQYSMWKGLQIEITTTSTPVRYSGSDILFTEGGHF